MRKLEFRPEIFILEQALDQVATGRLRVPDFQRPFKWSPQQMLDLFESVERGYPIGTLLVWQTELSVPSRDQVGDLAVPPPSENATYTYLLDGQQRVATLLNALRREAGAANTTDPADWKWWIYRDMTKPPGSADNPYVHRKGFSPEPTDMPVRCLLRTADFLDYCRTVQTHMVDTRRALETITWAEEVADQIKRHTISVVRLLSNDLGQAVEVFSRTNQAGEKIAADEMVSALTYQNPKDKTLASRIDELVDDLGQTGFDAIERKVVLRAILAVSGRDDIMSANWGDAVKELRSSIPSAVPHTRDAMLTAVDFLREKLKVPSVVFLPYAQQLVLLTLFFHNCPKPSQDQLSELRRWFWVTSWSGTFASISPGAMRRMVAEMREFAQGGTLKVDASRVQPWPEKFTISSARNKAYILWEINEFPERLEITGSPINLAERLRAEGGLAYRPIIPSDRSDFAASVANRMVLHTHSKIKPLEALRNIWAAEKQRVLSSHGIPQAAWDRLVEGKYDSFIQAREKFMQGKIQVFAQTLGVPGGMPLIGDAEPDTE